MRYGVFAVLASCLPLGTAAADEPFPYIVHVADDRAPIRSGPGEDYYETTLLARGTPVEVWRQAPGGWLAVRPPKESFCLVAADDVRLAPNRVAEVVRPDTPARIGSELTTDHNVVQVLLEQGERVRVLETITLEGRFWHRIAPPSGEFRWIHANAVSGTGPPAAAQIPDTFLPVESEPAPYRIAAFSTAAERNEAQPVAASKDVPQTLADVVQSPAAIANDAAVTLADVEVELATIVAEDSRFWHFAHLRRRCADLMASAGAAKRRECEAMLERIGRFEQIRDKKQLIASREPSAAGAPVDTETAERSTLVEDEPRPEARESLVAPERSVTWRAARGDAARRDDHQDMQTSRESGGDVVHIPDRPVTPVEDKDRYDGVGTLRPVVSRRAEAPRYALVDADGEVVTFITPSTGVNLQPYIGQRIGVIGTRGYMPEFKRAHVTAARVTPLR